MADDFDIKVEDLPKDVVNKAKQLLPNATWLGAVKVEAEGKIAYELDGTNGKGDFTVTVTAEGKIVECDENLSNPKTTTPAKVLNAITNKWPQFTVAESHLLRLGEDLKGKTDGDHLYDLHGTRANEMNVHVQVSAAGELLEWTNQIQERKVPGLVSQALKDKHPRFVPEAFYAISDKERIIGYKFESKGPKGREKSFFVSDDGKDVELVQEQD